MRVEHDVSPLSRARLPVDTTELAQYLIGKTIVRKVGRSRISGRIEMASADLPSEALSPVSLVLSEKAPSVELSPIASSIGNPIRPG